MRRDRRAKALSSLERNQAIVLAVPGLLRRMVVVLRIANHLPPLAELSQFAVSTQLQVWPAALAANTTLVVHMVPPRVLVR